MKISIANLSKLPDNEIWEILDKGSREDKIKMLTIARDSEELKDTPDETINEMCFNRIKAFDWKGGDVFLYYGYEIEY